MSRTSDFSEIKGVANIRWHLKTETSLCIKSGTTSAWKQATSNSRDGNTDKMRQVDARFDFFQKNIQDENDAQISDFYFDTGIKGNNLQIQYCIPASSVRGALRNYTIRRIIEKPFWNATDISKKEGDEEDPKNQENERQLMKTALKTPGWHLIQNLFGLATDSGEDELDAESVAGRLQVSVGKLTQLSANQFRANLLHGNFSEFRTGSTHGKMAIITRNPLDRVTQGAKKGGLHSFMELTPGNEFDVFLRITNPTPEDLGFVAFWEQGINTGLLRLGGLTTIGKGRLRILSTQISLFTRTADSFTGLNPGSHFSGDRLSDIFPEYTIENWQEARETYIGKLRYFYQSFGKEASDDRP
ncbi:RAMP superfamily CRISPR-associated protein [Desulfococcaceae bacterium HSG9]|nr:RAMP superfamily CRISPR-associated protein [Desulfococcaceae bacterium HSG9]